MSLSTRPRLCGIVPPLVTPLADGDALDVAGLERLVEHVVAGGVHGLFLLGTTGEGPSLGYRLRRELVERVCRQVAGRVPVLVAITDTAFVESLAVARVAADCGAAGVVAASPYYFPLNQMELGDYCRRLALAVSLPLYLYSMPAMTKVAFATETVRRLMDVENIAGIKDSSGDRTAFERLVRLRPHRPEWSFLIGPEHLTAWAVGAGGDGGVNGGANLLPSLFVRLYEAARAGDAARVAELQAQVQTLDGIYRAGDGNASIIQGLKHALALAHICSDLPAEPFGRLDDAGQRHVRQVVERLDGLPAG